MKGVCKSQPLSLPSGVVGQEQAVQLSDLQPGWCMLDHDPTLSLLCLSKAPRSNQSFFFIVNFVLFFKNCTRKIYNTIKWGKRGLPMCSFCRSNVTSTCLTTPTCFPADPWGDFTHNCSRSAHSPFHIRQLPFLRVSRPSEEASLEHLPDLWPAVLKLDAHAVTDLRGRKPLWLYMYCKTKLLGGD